jgi:phosphate transport system substrate-binding protein
MTAGSIVIAYNVPDVKDLKLSRKAYSGIFLGKIKKWNDPEIVKANPGAKLADQPINVVVRADSSGTSFVFSKHLSAINRGLHCVAGGESDLDRCSPRRCASARGWSHVSVGPL